MAREHCKSCSECEFYSIYSVDRWFGENHMNILVGEELAVQHYSYPDLYPSAQHGFSMNITAIAQPHGKVMFVRFHLALKSQERI